MKKTALNEAIIAFSLAILAAMLIKFPTLFDIQLDQNESFYLRNLSFFVLPLLTGYFAWKRNLQIKILLLSISAFIAGMGFANFYPFISGGDTEVLSAIHMPIFFWFVVGVVYMGGQWKKVNQRMNFIRFSGELFIYYVLIALSGGVLTGFMAVLFGTIHIDIEPFFESWLLPCGAAGAVIIAAWLVESRKDHSVNFAPVLAKLFSPLFAFMMITFLATMIFTGNKLIIERNILIAINLLLIVALALLMYSISSRNPESSPGIFDVVQLVLVIAALLVDAVALWSISERIAEFGFTPNRVAAIGLNLILIVNLAWSAVLNFRFLCGGINFSTLEKWHTQYIPVYGVWAAVVVILFPILFEFK